MVDRAQAIKPSSEVTRSEKLMKEGIPFIIEVAAMLLVADKLGPLSNPDMANTLFNQTVLYTTGIISRLGADVMFARANREDLKTGESFQKGFLIALATSYLKYHPDQNVVTDFIENANKVGTVVGQGVSDTLQDIGQKLTTPTISPEQIAQLQSDIQNRQETLYTDLAPLGTIIGIALPVGIGVKLWGEKLAQKYKETKKNLGTAIELSRDFFSKLRNIGNRSPESVLSDIQAQISTLEAELKAININPDIATEANTFADKIHATIGRLSKVEARIRLEARVPRTTHSRRRSHLG